MSENNENEHPPLNPPLKKRFMLRCPRCRWARIINNQKTDLDDLIYIKPNCAGCGKIKKYKCIKCGTPCPLKKI